MSCPRRRASRGGAADWAPVFTGVTGNTPFARSQTLCLNGAVMTNALYYGDNLTVLREHVPDESVDLVYLAPPFNSNASYNEGPGD